MTDYTPEERAVDVRLIRSHCDHLDDTPYGASHLARDFERIAAQHESMVPYELASRIAGAITDDEHTAATMELLKWKPKS